MILLSWQKDSYLPHITRWYRSQIDNSVYEFYVYIYPDNDRKYYEYHYKWIDNGLVIRNLSEIATSYRYNIDDDLVKEMLDRVLILDGHRLISEDLACMI